MSTSEAELLVAGGMIEGNPKADAVPTSALGPQWIGPLADSHNLHHVWVVFRALGTSCWRREKLWVSPKRACFESERREIVSQKAMGQVGVHRGLCAIVVQGSNNMLRIAICAIYNTQRQSTRLATTFKNCDVQSPQIAIESILKLFKL